MREEEKLGKAYDAKYVSRLMKYVGPYWKLVSLVVLMLLVMTVIDLYMPKLVADAIDTHIKIVGAKANPGEKTDAKAARPPLTEAEKNEHLDAIQKVALMVFLLVFISAIFTFGQMYTLVYTGQRVICDIRREVFFRLQTLPMSYFHKNPIGRIVTRVTYDASVVNEAFSGVVVYLFKDLFLMTGILIILFAIEPTLTFIILTPIPLVIGISMLFRALHRKAYRWTREAIARVNAFMHESFSGVNIIKMFNREEQSGKDFAEVNSDNFRANFSIIILSGIFNPLIMLVTNFSISLLLWFGGLRVLEGSITFGGFFLFFTYLRMFFQPIQDFSQKYVLMQSAMAASERMFALLDTVDEIPNPPVPKKLEPFRGEIEFRNVSFSYDGKTEAVKNVSFKVNPGETFALVGNTGSGKTTITNLITRFYDVTAGAVLVDGIDVRELDKYGLRKRIAMVTQDVFLFSTSIIDNIRLANPDISEEGAKRAAVSVGADEFITALSNGYNEPVTERGGTLSSGQRQLISFARALAFNRGILILDEATANIDSKSELLIQEATKKLLEGRTAVVVAHRLSTIRNANRIIVLEAGRIIEEGTHDELMLTKGTYWRMYSMQFEGLCTSA